MRFKRLLAKILRFGLLKKLRHGGKITIFPSFACNYKCDYCSLRVNGVMPKNKTLPFEKWKYFLEAFDEATIDNNGIREVILTGGEPTLLPYFTELCNWILFEKKWFLTIFTNLSNYKLLELKPSLRLRIGATLHHHVDPDEFTERYLIVNKYHRIDVEEIIGYGHTKKLPYSKGKPFLTEYEIENLVACLRVSPDQSIHLTCREACINFCK